MTSGVKQVIQNVARLFADPATSAPIIPNQITYTPPDKEIESLSTGFRPLDRALGIGGLPLGKITELIGPDDTLISDGPLYIAARIASKAQRQQEIITIIDMNHSFDPWQAERCGLVAPHLLSIRPDTIFEMLTNLENAARHAKLVLITMGTVTHLLQHIEPDLLHTLMRRLQNIIGRTDSVCLILTTAPTNDPFAPENYPPGFPLADVAHVRLWLQDENWTRKNGLTTTYKTTITVVKNDFAMVGAGANLRIRLTSP